MDGILYAMLFAVPAYILGLYFPIVGGPVFGILLGMLFAKKRRPQAVEAGIQFTGKKILQYAIVLLGFEMNLFRVAEVGEQSLYVMVFTLLAAFGAAFLMGHVLGLTRDMTALVGAGTAICGGSAIAAVAPVIGARERDVAVSIATIFFFNVLAVFLFPALGHQMGMTDAGFGMWAGTAINDTSSVVAAGYAYSAEAGADAHAHDRACVPLLRPADDAQRGKERRGILVAAHLPDVRALLRPRLRREYGGRAAGRGGPRARHGREIRHRARDERHRAEHRPRVAAAQRTAPARTRHGLLDCRCGDVAHRAARIGTVIGGMIYGST